MKEYITCQNNWTKIAMGREGVNSLPIAVFYIFLRYSEGDMPFIFLNMRLKYKALS